MQAAIDVLFGSTAMSPLGVALAWRSEPIALMILGELALAAALVTVAVLAARRLGGLESSSLRRLVLFAAGLGVLAQAVAIVVFWQPAYGVLGLARLAFGLLAAFAAVRFASGLMRRRDKDASDGRRLAQEADRDRRLVLELRESNAELERHVEARTRELVEAKDRFEAALAGSRITVATQDRDLRYRWVHNPPLGRNAEDLLGRSDADILPDDAAAQLNAVKFGVMNTGQPASTEIEAFDPARGRIWLRVHVSPHTVAGQAVEGVHSVVIDVTDERRRADMLEHVTQALAEANARFDTALGGSNISMFRQDRDLRYTWIHNPPPGISAEDFLGRDDEASLPEPAARALVPAKRRVMETGAPDRLEFALRVGDAVRWFDMRIEPLAERHRIVGLMSVAIDITDQKEHQQQMKVVMRELTHRSKNLLAVVQGIARQTAQTVEDLPTFVDRFGARLQALARAHDILVDESWRGASLDELIASQLGHVIEKADDRLDDRGERVMLKPEAAQNVALALHELATNAAKYGALSTPDGRIAVRWGLHEPEPADSGAAPTFEITWQERGGPPVAEPKRKGFGRLMIERLVPRAIDGTSELVFDPQGIRWTLRFPTEYLAEVTPRPDRATTPAVS
ncbi:sensor histidine kinase [Prosthecomicrobium sp. N25]|uniref:sensor histidine kinase n=1 Tax=Prosthecomicrobium sp. N25 TaxID=3129254 RepID=UPI0030773920